MSLNQYIKTDFSMYFSEMLTMDSFENEFDKFLLGAINLLMLRIQEEQLLFIMKK